ncbi:MAG TPA: alpha/beta hydrolase [Clostridia bacterium]|nr:alpha/beta hydrolase [Clostridia bacterium]
MVGRIATLAVIVTLVATACTSNAPLQAKATPSPTSVTWTACTPAGFECGSVQVPLDYAHPDAGTISIALNRKPATDQANRIGSVLTNPGGPGASGIQFLQGEAASMTNLNRRFDLIGFDPRGIGASAPVRCLNGPEEDTFNALDSVLDDPAEKAAAIQADKDFAAGCMQRSARVLPFVDTVSAAKDMDLIRAALGDTKLTYLGFSYGTFLGQMYAHLFPTHVRALALDGVLDPSLSANDLLVAQLVGFQRNLEAFLADCSARKTSASPCTFAASGNPTTKLNDLMKRLDTTPLPVGSRALTRSLAVTGVLLGLYSESFWPTLDTALTSADQGSGSLLLRLADFYLARNADGTYDNETDANFAVNCLDRPVPTDISFYDQLGPAYAKDSPLFGPSFQYSNLGCAYWPVKPTGQAGPLTAAGAPPILLVGGTDDPATPYAWAQAVNQQLAGSVLLTRNGNGHTSYDASTCAHTAIDSYLINLTLPAVGAVCTQ